MVGAAAKWLARIRVVPPVGNPFVTFWLPAMVPGDSWGVRGGGLVNVAGVGGALGRCSRRLLLLHLENRINYAQ